MGDKVIPFPSKRDLSPQERAESHAREQRVKDLLPRLCEVLDRSAIDPVTETSEGVEFRVIKCRSAAFVFHLYRAPASDSHHQISFLMIACFGFYSGVLGMIRWSDRSDEGYSHYFNLQVQLLASGSWVEDLEGLCR